MNKKKKNNRKCMHFATVILIFVLVLCGLFYQINHSLIIISLPSAKETIVVVDEKEGNNDHVLLPELPPSLQDDNKKDLYFKIQNHHNNNNNNEYKKKNLSIIERAREFGFWQRMQPVPKSKWDVVSNGTCYNNNNGSTEPWERQIPSVLVLGTQKGGTTALAYYLYQHSSILYLPIKELRFLDEYMDQHYFYNNSDENEGSAGINSQHARKQYQNWIQNKTGLSMKVLQVDFHKQILDATPNYLFLSDRVPDRTFCICPWVKLIILLRNPIHRLVSQYNMQYHRDLRNPSRRKQFVTLQEYIQNDIAVLQQLNILSSSSSSLLQNQSVKKTIMTPTNWSTYTKLGLNSPVGRGLYSIQLQQWMDAMDRHGKSKESDLLIIPSEELFQNPNATHAKVLKFLNLKPQQLSKYNKIHAGNYNENYNNNGYQDYLSPNLKKLLQDIYTPYNRQLDELLLSSSLSLLRNDNATQQNRNSNYFQNLWSTI